METETQAPFDWLRYVSKVLVDLDEVPLFGSPPAFPWGDFSTRLSQCFGVEGFEFQPSDWRWCTPEEVLSGLGDPLKPVHFSLSPLAGSACWLMSEDSINELMGWFLRQSPEVLQTPDSDYREAFYRFVALEAIHVCHQLQVDSTLSPRLSSNAALPDAEALCLNVALKFQEQQLWGRLVVTPELRKSVKEHYAAGPPTPLAQRIAQDLEVTVLLEGGKTTMTPSQWAQVSPGDFIILDSLTVEPGQEKGRIILTVNGKPVFRGMVKKDKIKILEYPLYSEAESTMDPDVPEEEENNAHSKFEEFEEETPQQPLQEEEPFPPEEEGEAVEGEAEAMEGEELPAEEVAGEGAIAEEEGEEELYSEEAAAAAAPQQPAAPALKTDEIPMTVTVEVGRIKMNVKTLMDLQPGNMLELGVHPEQGVDLTVSGKKVGHGELLRIGEMLGVRVLEVG